MRNAVLDAAIELLGKYQSEFQLGAVYLNLARPMATFMFRLLHLSVAMDPALPMVGSIDSPND